MKPYISKSSITISQSGFVWTRPNKPEAKDKVKPFYAPLSVIASVLKLLQLNEKKKNHYKDLRSHLGVEVGTSSLAFATLKTITELEPKCVLCFWERYWGRGGPRLANFFTSLVTMPEVFAKVNLAQFPRF